MWNDLNAVLDSLGAILIMARPYIPE